MGNQQKALKYKVIIRVLIACAVLVLVWWLTTGVFEAFSKASTSGANSGRLMARRVAMQKNTSSRKAVQSSSKSASADARQSAVGKDSTSTSSSKEQSSASLIVRKTDGAAESSVTVGKLSAGEAITVGRTTMNAQKLAQLTKRPLEVVNNNRGVLTLTKYDSANGKLSYRYDPKKSAGSGNVTETVAFTSGRESLRGTNGFGAQPLNPTPWGDNDAKAEQSYERVAKLGLQWVRVLASWYYVQPQKGGACNWRYVDKAVDLADKYGLKVMIQIVGVPEWASGVDTLSVAKKQELDSRGLWVTNFAPKAEYEKNLANFVGETVSRYSKRGVLDYEFWNEPGNQSWKDNLNDHRPNPEHYTHLLKKVYAAAHSANSGVNVLAGGMTVGETRADGNYISAQDFLKRMYAAGAKGNFDSLSHHPYGVTGKGFGWNGWAMMNGDIVAPRANEKTLRQIMSENGDNDKMIWPTEVGITARSSREENTQANTIQELIKWQNKANYTGPIILYQAQNDRAPYISNPARANPEKHFGLWQYNGTPKAAVNTIASLVKPTTPIAKLTITIKD